MKAPRPTKKSAAARSAELPHSGVLNQTAEYALRAMSALAVLPMGRSATAKEVAHATGIPSAYVSKILRRLVVANLVTAQRGHGGGFGLARAPRAIAFAEILEAVGAGLHGEACVFGWGACSTKDTCPLHPAWSQLKKSVLSWANSTTLGHVDTSAFARLAVAGVPAKPAHHKRGALPVV